MTVISQRTTELIKTFVKELMKQFTPSLEVVKYHDMPNKRWYMSPHHKGWYYHVPRLKESNPEMMILEPTLDPCLKTLAVSLNAMGYKTLPSCSGHYLSQEQCDKIYNDLLKDCDLIRTTGLDLIDVENGSIMKLYDPAWQLPWDKEQFHGIASGTESKPEGYIGFVVPDERHDILKLFSDLSDKIPGVKFNVFSDGQEKKCEIRVYTGEPTSQCRTWKFLGDAIKNI